MMRSELKIELKCDDCGSDLEVSAGNSDPERNSAYNYTMKLSVIPCQKCKDKYIRPALLISEALRCLKAEQRLEGIA